jgi:hypothetical protein
VVVFALVPACTWDLLACILTDARTGGGRSSYGTNANQFAQQDGERQAAAMFCQYYLRNNQMYQLLTHLPQIGSRMRKNWFVVRRTREADQLMVLQSVVYLITPWLAFCGSPFVGRTRLPVHDPALCCYSQISNGPKTFLSGTTLMRFRQSPCAWLPASNFDGG